MRRAPRARLLALLVIALIVGVAPRVHASTGASRAGAELFYFIHITDTHVGSGSCDLGRLRTLADQISSVFWMAPIKPLAVVHTGDITDHGYAEEFQEYRSSFLDRLPSSLPVLHVPGNHDVRRAGYSPFASYIGPIKGYDDIPVAGGYVRFIRLCTAVPDHDEGYLTPADRDEALRWIEEADRDPRCVAIFVLGHHPPAPNTDENVARGGHDYKATPFNDILGGDPWALVRDLILGHRKVLAYLCGHVHTNWLTWHYGKAFIITAPPTLPGPWKGPYEVLGYVYRLVVWDDGVLSTAVFRVGRWPAALITNIPQGALLSGKVLVRILAFSSSGIRAVEVYVDGAKVASASAVSANEFGGLYEAIVDVSALEDGQHELEAHVVDGAGREYWTRPKVFFFARVAGGLRVAKSELAAYGFGVWQDRPCVRLYIYSESTEERLPFIAVYVPVDARRFGRVELRALVETEHIYSRMRMRLTLNAWRAEPAPSDSAGPEVGIAKLIAGICIEKNDAKPYDCCIWRASGSTWGEYRKIGDVYPMLSYWVQVAYEPGVFHVRVQHEDRVIEAAEEYALPDHDYDDIRYVGIMVRTDPGYYSQYHVIFLEILADGVPIVRLHMVPHVLGIPARLDLRLSGGELAARLTAGASGVAGAEIILEASDDGISWHEIARARTDADGVARFPVPNASYARVRFDGKGCEIAPAVSKVVVLRGAPGPKTGEEVEKLREELRQKELLIANLTAELNRLRQQLDATLSELGRLKAQLRQYEQQLAELQASLEQKDRAVASLQDKLARREQELIALSGELERMRALAIAEAGAIAVLALILLGRRRR